MEVVDLFKHYFGEDGGEESSAVESHEIGSYDVTPQEEDEPRCIDTSEGVAVVPHEEGAGAEPVAEEPDPRTAEQKQARCSIEILHKNQCFSYLSSLGIRRQAPTD